MEALGEVTGTLPAGFQFGAYVIGSCIGHGGMARIYRAEHRALRKPVALKVMDGALLERPDGRPRFLREGQAAAAVKHPNVVDITDVGVWQGRPYLVMELLEGEDLEQYLSRNKPLAEADIARLMIPVIAGLAAAHASGVIHRDLKPSNIFLARGADGETVPKLLDFGISKLANGVQTLNPSSTPVGELMGSPMYMSPEAVRGARDLTPHSDQYSLGVVLYECITGRPPFFGESLLGVLEAVAHGKFETPRKYRPDISRVLEGAIMRAMSQDPADRFASVRDLGRALCETADHRTRLLWMPSFGVHGAPAMLDATHRAVTERHSSPDLRSSVDASRSFDSMDPFSDRELGRSVRTASLGPSPMRTGSPLTASVFGRSPRNRQRRQVLWGGLGALALLGLGLLLYTSAPGPAAVPYAGPARSEVSTEQVQRAALPSPAARPAALPAPSISGEEAQRTALEPAGGRTADSVNRDEERRSGAPQNARQSGVEPIAGSAPSGRPEGARNTAAASDDDAAARSRVRRPRPAPAPPPPRAVKQRPVDRAEPESAPIASAAATSPAPAAPEPSDIPLRSNAAETSEAMGANQSPILD